jgi:hypothetical protein
LEAEIRLVYKNEREAEAVAKAVSPDNVQAPPGLLIKTVQNGSEVYTKVDCQTRLQMLLATLDDLLACISVAEKAFKISEKK